MSRNATLIALCALLVGGCAKYQAQPLDRAAILQDLRTTSVDELVQRHGGTAADASPVDLSDGLGEAELVGVALTLNPDLKAKRLEIGEAQSLLVAAGIWPNPELGVSAADGIGGAPGYTLGADLLFEVLRPGERSARRKAAEAQVAAKRAEIAAAEYRLAGEVRLAWLEVLAAEAQAVQLQRVAELQHKSADLLGERRLAGDVTELDLVASQISVRETERDLREAVRAVAGARMELNRLTGLPPAYEMRLSDVGKPLAIRTIPSLSPAELEQRMLAGRLELKVLEADYERAEQELRLAVLQQYPRMAIGPTFGRELEGDESLGLGASIELPLFDRNQSQIGAKRAQRDQLRQAYAAALHEMRAEVGVAYAQVLQTADELRVQEQDLLPLVERNERLYGQAFQAGEAAVLDWIVAQEKAMDARREYLSAAVKHRKALVALETAIGRALAPADTTQQDH